MKAYLIAGEASGDRLGAALMEALRVLKPAIAFHGVGGSLMAQHGLNSLFPMNELSVMGLAEILPKYRHLKRRIAETAQDVLAQAPDVLITIDSPDFCHRVAKQVKAARPDLHICHYVAPSVWAWRPGRAAKMAGHIDQVLALLPFEPPYMEAHGMRCDFVGHPVVTEPVPTADEVQKFRSEHGLTDRPSLLVLPGSRQNEVARLTGPFGEAVAHIRAAKPDLQVIIPAARNVVAAVQEATGDWPGAPVILDPSALPAAEAEARKRTAFAAADVAIAASGTVSLELAHAATPMVIAYDMNWLSWQIMSRMVRVDTVTLVNLVTGKKAVPEFLGPACKGADIGQAALNLFEDQVVRDEQLTAMHQTMEVLGAGGPPPGERAARAVLDALA